MVLQSPGGFMIECAIKLDFPTTNNEERLVALITLGSCWIVLIKAHLKTS